MALSRWSHSDWYVYEIGPDEDGIESLQVCMFGYYNIDIILNNYEVIEKQAKEDGYPFLSRLELRLYLKDWAKYQTNQMDRKTYLKRLNLLRQYGIVKTYISDPWATNWKSLKRYFK